MNNCRCEALSGLEGNEIYRHRAPASFPKARVRSPMTRIAEGSGRRLVGLGHASLRGLHSFRTNSKWRNEPTRNASQNTSPDPIAPEPASFLLFGTNFWVLGSLYGEGNCYRLGLRTEESHSP